MEEIRRRVELLLKNSHQEIIVAAFTQAVRLHNPNRWRESECKCEYCELHNDYVANKMQIHSLNRCYQYSGMSDSVYEYLNILAKQNLMYKELKHKLKTI